MKGDDFIREVDEAVRQERWVSLWKQYGAYIVGGAIAIVVGTAAGVAWREYQASEQAESARRFAEAVELMRAEQPADAAAAFTALAEDADEGYATLARLRAAEARDRAGDTTAKLDMLETLAENDDVDALYRQLSRLLAAQERIDQAAPDDVASRVAELAEAQSPWRYSALELEALAQIRAGEVAAARETLARLIDDPSAPANLVQRASELQASLGGPITEGGVAMEPTAGDTTE